MPRKREPKRLPTNVDAFTDARKAAFLLALVETGSIRGAAARTDVSRQTVYEHANKDPSFREQIEKARGEFEQAALAAIWQAGTTGEVIARRGKKITKPGDWHAIAWLLEHSPAYRESYAGILRQKVEMGQSPDLPPLELDVKGTVDLEIGPGTMERLGAVVQVLLRQGLIRLPEPNEVIEGQAEDASS